MQKKNRRTRIVYERDTGKLFLAESDDEICPLIPSSGVSEQQSPNGYILEKNTISLCKAGPSSFGLVRATQKKSNTGFGKMSLFSLLEGTENSAYGKNSGKSLAEGQRNTFIGSLSSPSLVEGKNNSCLGWGSLHNLEKGNSNVAIGSFAGNNLVYGSENIFVGARTSTKQDCIEGSVVVGADGVAETSNELSISCSLKTFRARGLSSRGICSNSTMLCYNPLSGILAPCCFPKTKGKPVPELLINKILDLDIQYCDWTLYPDMEQLSRSVELVCDDHEGKPFGANHGNILMLLVATVQKLWSHQKQKDLDGEKQKQEISVLLEKQQEKIELLEKRISELSSKDERQKILSQRAEAPLKISAVGELRQRAIPLEAILQDWENIS